MKPDIHPKYSEVTITCSCGHKFTTSSAIGRDSLHVDICSKCHPFFTGQQKMVDTAGRIDKFNQKYAKRNAAVANKEKEA